MKANLTAKVTKQSITQSEEKNPLCIYEVTSNLNTLHRAIWSFLQITVNVKVRVDISLSLCKSSFVMQIGFSKPRKEKIALTGHINRKTAISLGNMNANMAANDVRTPIKSIRPFRYYKHVLSSFLWPRRSSPPRQLFSGILSLLHFCCCCCYWVRLTLQWDFMLF